MRTLERGLGTVFLTVGLTVLVGLPAMGARPTLSGAEFGLTATAVGGVASVALGIWLYVRVGQESKKMGKRIGLIGGYLSRGRDIRDRVLAVDSVPRLPALQDEAEAWVGTVHDWLRQELPTYSEMFMVRRTQPRGRIDGVHVLANDLADKVDAHIDNLVTILQNVTRDQAGA